MERSRHDKLDESDDSSSETEESNQWNLELVVRNQTAQSQVTGEAV